MTKLRDRFDIKDIELGLRFSPFDWHFNFGHIGLYYYINCGPFYVELQIPSDTGNH